jgi:ribonuclease G
MKRELIVNAAAEETRIALLEDGLPAELFIERASAPSILGRIYRGRISNVLPGMQSAFVDIGLDRDAFLYVADLLPPAADLEPAPGEGVFPPVPVRRRGPPIESLLKEGQEIVVQVTKDALGSKGPRVTTQISLPGRTLVFLPGASRHSVSRRVESEEERNRLLRLAGSLPGEGGFIVRTAAKGADLPALDSEARGRRARWEEIRRASEASAAPACLSPQADLAEKVLRDLVSPDMERIVVDDEPTHRRCRDFVERILPGLGHRVEKFSREEAIFEAFGVEKELERALRRRIWLPSGGYIVIHPTEALVAIDVNTGKYVGKTGFEETALKTNLEAAREVVRQIRLRDLGGILVVDFIDLEEEESRRRLAEALEEELKSDRARSRVLKISDFGLVEITRQRMKKSLETLLCRSCPTCRGSGRVKSAETLRFQIQRELRKVLPLLGGRAAVIRAHPEVASAILGNLPLLRRDLGVTGTQDLQIEAVEGFHPEHFEILGG